MTAAASLPRLSSGFSVTNILAEFCAPPPPTYASTDSTSVSCRTRSANAVTRRFIAWNEVSWSAWICPVNRPVSCCGKNPFGIAA
jgi:hypothetical protein